MAHLPLPLQQAIAQARAHLNQTENGEIDIDDLIAISQLFGNLNDLPYTYTHYHTRRFLLILLSLRALVPHWENLQRKDHSFQQHLSNLARVVLRSISIEEQRTTLETIWDWSERQQPTMPFLDTVRLSVYTLLKVVSAIAEPYLDYGYQPDTHGDVALQLVGHAYQVFPRSYVQPASVFWDYWLVSIVPAAWFPIPSDTQ